jgi:hypothetical protein
MTGLKAPPYHVFSLRLYPDTCQEVLSYAQARSLNRTDAVRELIGPDWLLLTEYEKEAIHMILHKISRAIAAKMVADRCE